ncbi:MAG: hypothetical protein CM15mP46_4880 [Alphaproteobacteria bacterium]|nr:MAG: hypothetical protein CM15mP46_4880 [Alphaproteobacteria bacterium]
MWPLDGAVQSCFDQLAKEWQEIDFVVHAWPFRQAELKGAYLDTSRDNFINTMMISAYSLPKCPSCRPMMPLGSLVTLSYIGAQRITPNYNVMGVAKPH